MDKIVEDLVVGRLGDAPLLVGVSGCQGSGKTTLTTKAAEALNQRGIATIALSIDDFYVPHADQVALAARGNPLLQHRGLFPSHDVVLMLKVLGDLKSGRPTSVPIYDKARFEGQGDRVGERALTGPYRAIILEGWCLGFEPVGEQTLSRALASSKPLALKHHSLQNLSEIDTALKAYVPAWSSLDLMVYLRPAALEFIYEWRLQQEHGLIAKHGTGMSDSQVKQFVDQYMPAYELYQNTVRAELSFLLQFDRSFVPIS